MRYTYGSEGDLEYAYTVETTQLAFGVNVSIQAVGTITNIGKTTVRLAPTFTVKALGPNDVPFWTHNEDCTHGDGFPPDDHVFVEVAPGSSRSYGLGFAVHWVANASAPPTEGDRACGAFLLDRPGTYRVTAVMSSGPLLGATTLPVWNASVPAPVMAFTAS